MSNLPLDPMAFEHMCVTCFDFHFEPAPGYSQNIEDYQ